MDLAAEALRLQLDVLAVDLCGALAQASIPHVLLKGPSTSTWLYDPPRPYSDVDVLVPSSLVDRAAAVARDAGLTTSRAGTAGEEAPHSLLLHTPAGLEVDLHFSLPAVPPDGDRIWDVLEGHVVTLAMDVGTVPILDVTGRCLVLALHSLASGAAEITPHDDLDRAWRRYGSEVWKDVRDLADRLEVRDLVDAGLSRCDPGVAPSSRRSRLHAANAPAVALGVQRLLDSPRHQLPRMVAREIFPTRGFMANVERVDTLRGGALLAAHFRRWRRLLRQLPPAARSWRGSH